MVLTLVVAAGMAIMKDILKQPTEAGKIAEEAPRIMTTMTTETHTVTAADKEEDGTVIMKDIQKQQKEDGKTGTTVYEEEAIMMTTTIMATMVKEEAGMVTMKGILKQPGEAGETGTEAPGAGIMIRITRTAGMTEAQAVAASLPWMKMK
jgi:hypothetical protein